MKTITSIILGVLLISSLLLLGCTQQDPATDNNAGFERFDSYDSLVASFKEAQEEGIDNYYGKGILEMDMVMGVNSESTPTGTGNDFSETNIQVQGVDEADIVKTDGEYIYSLSSSKLVITKAFPLENSEIVFNKLIENVAPKEMFVNGDKLLIFGSTQNNYYKNEEMGLEKMMPDCYDCYYDGGKFIAQLYDISDKTNPVMIKELKQNGSYLSSRLIGDTAYFIINSTPSYQILYADSKITSLEDANSIIPIVSIDGVSSPVAKATEIGFVHDVSTKSFMTIYSLNMNDKKINKEVFASRGQNVYASAENIYIASEVYRYDKEIQPLNDKNTVTTNKQAANPIGEAIDTIAEPMTEMMMPRQIRNRNTVIAKFSIENGNISFVGKGEVNGNILNQFSMDEHKGNFRIATTIESSHGEMSEDRSTNNIFVLNEEMKTVGVLEDLAPNEKIYSARFMGDKGYVVTFKYIDPLFVIDLSDATNPHVLGKLKIPGYSDYLHPIDETHLLGIGRDVNELEDLEKVHSTGAVYYTAIKGVKMAIFDVSDVEHPKETHKVIIGGRGTNSEALNEHKAILFDTEKQLMVFPITISEEAEENNGYIGSNQVFQGALVYNVSIDSGFSERGRITHATEEDELKRGYYYSNNSLIRRSLYINDVLFTISSNSIKANNLNSLEELKIFDLSK
jgi:inhibitor of cysteine peptidase